MEEAAAKTGLDDFGDPAFGAPLALLLDSCGASGVLTTRGWAVLRSVVLRHLRNRLYIQAYARARGSRREAVDEAVVITGLPRTGTSLLHGLLASDLRHRFLRLWEGLHPVPPGRAGAPDRKELIGQAGDWVRRLYEHAPRFRVVRDLSPEGPEECDSLLQNAFASQHFIDMFDPEGYSRWFLEGDLSRAYEYYALQLALLGTGHLDRWVLKSPGHLGHLDSLLSALPGARVIHCHRDPAEAVVSYASLILAVRSPNCDGVSPEAVGRQALDRSRRSMQRALEARAEAGGRFFDVPYSRLTADPLGVVAEIYGWLETPFDRRAEERMRLWLEEHPRGRHGPHRYDPTEFGLTSAGIRESFSGYLDRFGSLSG